MSDENELDPQALFDKATAGKSEQETPVPVEEVVEAETATEETPEPKEAVAEVATDEEPTEEAKEPEPVEEPAKSAPETHIPKKQYDEIRAKQKAAQEAADARAQENAALQGRLEQLERFIIQQRQPAQEPVEEPDLYSDPEAVVRNMQQNFSTQLQHMKVQTSLDIAAMKYADEYGEAEKFVIGQKSPALARAIMEAPNPGEATVQYYRQNKTLEEVGTDPLAYRERVRAEIEAELLADPATLQKVRSHVSQGNGTSQGSKPHIAPSVNQGGRAGPASTGSRMAEPTPQELFQIATGGK